MGEAPVGMTIALDTSFADLLMVACELAVKVECSPLREDGITPAATYKSSGRTLALRLKQYAGKLGGRDSISSAPVAGVAPYCYTVTLQVKSARATRYTLWLDESPAQVEEIVRKRKLAEELRAGLPHHERKRKPWGPL